MSKGGKTEAYQNLDTIDFDSNGDGIVDNA